MNCLVRPSHVYDATAREWIEAWLKANPHMAILDFRIPGPGDTVLVINNGKVEPQHWLTGPVGKRNCPLFVVTVDETARALGFHFTPAPVNLVDVYQGISVESLSAYCQQYRVRVAGFHVPKDNDLYMPLDRTAPVLYAADQELNQPRLILSHGAPQRDIASVWE